MTESTAAKKMRMDSERVFAHPSTMADLGKKLLNSKEDCDVFFLVGLQRERFGAHKLILKLRSPVFEVMFSPRWNEGSACDGQEIVLENDEPSNFRSFLEYVYADMFSATSVQAVKLFHLAQFYEVLPLCKLCEEAIVTKSFTSDELLQVFLVARKYKIGFALNLSLLRIARNFIVVGNSAIFEKLDESTLILFLGRDDLCVGEAQLFSILLKWADKQIKNSAQDPKPERKDVLKNLIPLVRFPTMTPKEFTSVVAPTNVLPEQAVIRLFMYLTSDGESRTSMGDSLPYIKARRRGMPLRLDLYKGRVRPGDGAYPDTVLRKRSDARDILTFTLNDSERITEKEFKTTIVSLVLQGPQCSDGLFKNSSRFRQELPLKVGISLCLATGYCDDGNHQTMFPVNQEVIVDVGSDEMEVTLDRPWEISSDKFYKITLRFLSDVYVVPASLDVGDGNGKQRRDESLDLFTPAVLLDVSSQKSAAGIIELSGVSMSTGKSEELAGVPAGQAYLLQDCNTLSTGLHLLRALKISALVAST